MSLKSRSFSGAAVDLQRRDGGTESVALLSQGVPGNSEHHVPCTPVVIRTDPDIRIFSDFLPIHVEAGEECLFRRNAGKFSLVWSAVITTEDKFLRKVQR